MSFQEIKKRLEYLELWRELAIRPLEHDVHPDDLHMLEKEVDDLKLLSKKCLQVRQDMNQNLPPHDLALDHTLMVMKSQIPNSGNGLFFEPQGLTSNIEECSTTSATQHGISEGSIICYYTGHRHNFYSQKYLANKSYLLHVDRDILVDPRETLQIKARYVNDPLNEKLVNCKYVPDPDEYRCKVVATRIIRPGEELFISYGDFYWKQQPHEGTIYHG